MALWRGLPSARGLALWAAATAVALAAGALIVNWSGLYNVAASQGHWRITNWFLETSLRNSIETHSMFIEPPPLDNPDLTRFAAGHFELVCAACHGSPARPEQTVAARMLPMPPPLSQAASHWEDSELFWIVKHGLKFTGMPGWVTLERDDEVWALVAFLRQLPEMGAEDYRALALGNLDRAASSGGEPFPLGETPPRAVASCARCHDDGKAPPVSGFVPKLAGQKRDYLRFALDSYARGLRPSGIMQPIAAALAEDERTALADYFSSVEPGPSHVSEAEAASAERVARGRRIASEGLAGEGIPPCLACHNDGSRGAFPRIAGQSAAYLESQLRLLRAGLRDRTTLGAIMTAIAQRLSDGQIEDAAAYFASADGALAQGVATADEAARPRDAAP